MEQFFRHVVAASTTLVIPVLPDCLGWTQWSSRHTVWPRGAVFLTCGGRSTTLVIPVLPDCLGWTQWSSRHTVWPHGAVLQTRGGRSTTLVIPVLPDCLGWTQWSSRHTVWPHGAVLLTRGGRSTTLDGWICGGTLTTCPPLPWISAKQNERCDNILKINETYIYKILG